MPEQPHDIVMMCHPDLPDAEPVPVTRKAFDEVWSQPDPRRRPWKLWKPKTTKTKKEK